MAKQIAAEQFVLDNVVIAKDSSNKLVFNNIAQMDSSDVSSIELDISTENTNRSNAVDSLDLRVSKETSKRSSAVTSENARVLAESEARSNDIDSLDTRVAGENTNRSNAVDSLDIRVSKETSKRSSAVTSEDARVNTAETNRSDDIVSLDIRLSKEERNHQVSLDIPLFSSTSSKTINYTNMGFVASNPPVAHVNLRYTGDTSSEYSILASQISGAANHTGMTVVFSDDIPGDAGESDYVLDIILSSPTPPDQETGNQA